MRSTIVSACLLALTLLSSQAALARPIDFEGNAESDLALRNSDIVADGLELDARSIEELFDQLEARTKRVAGSPRGGKPRGPSPRGGAPRGGQNQRQRAGNQNQNRNSGGRKSTGIGRAIGRFLNSGTGQNIASTLAGGIAQRIANGGRGAQPAIARRELEEYLEARTRRRGNSGGRKSTGIGKAIGRFLKSGTGQDIATTLAGGVAQRIANGGRNGAAQPGYRRELEEYLEDQ
ncbi:hypothetical protein EST38_g11412 [Candolleomyces aberdarensis]|uniref:Uncharacterized protein n=1 Tax=Candolleomyces aberdarensis TaxID=2316362 RepID=A0A4Q2D6F3_9AGAR|nr:hypothetical protein EST38_g11412 [Candolleomyces aberdarensis]